MPVSGTVPYFEYTTADNFVRTSYLQVQQQIQPDASGLVGLMRRALGTLSQVSGVSRGGQGLVTLQQNLALRIADLEKSGEPNDVRLAHANAILTASGEVQP